MQRKFFKILDFVKKNLDASQHFFFFQFFFGKEKN